MKNKAFTLIELLVVILIIGIITAIVLPQYQKAVEKVRYSQLAWNIQEIYNALERYKLTTGEYPPASFENVNDPSLLSSALDIDIPPHPSRWYLFYRPLNHYVAYYNLDTRIWINCGLPNKACTCGIGSGDVTTKKVELCRGLCKNPQDYSGSGEYTCSL